MVGLRFSKDNSNSDFTSFSSVVSSFVVWGITFSWLSLLISGFLDLNSIQDDFWSNFKSNGNICSTVKRTK